VTGRSLFDTLEAINAKPEPFSVMTIPELWTDPHISEQMLRYHLDDAAAGASRPSHVADQSVAWMSETFGLGAGSRVVDLGCGPGQYTLRLARTGAAVTGVDVSRRSIAHATTAAAAAGLDVRHVVADYLEWAPNERFDLAIMIYHDYGAMSPDQRHRLLERLAELLEPDGSFVFDVSSVAGMADVEETAAYAPRMMNGFWAPSPYHGFLNTFVYDAEHVSVDRYEIVERDRTRTFWTWTQYFDPDSLSAELASGGFDVAQVLGDVTGRPYDPTSPEFAVVARRSSQIR
jgi:SAM-dependent methyltransferase